MKYKQKKCAQCDNVFEPRSGRQKYCSDTCKSVAVQHQTSKGYKRWYKKNKSEEIERTRKYAEETDYQKKYQKTQKFKDAKRRHYLQNKEYYHQKTKEYRERVRNDKLQASKESSDKTRKD